MKRILCACECSQTLTKEWLKAGFQAWSCDLVDSFGEYPERHIKDDVMNVIDYFDVVFAFPPCTDLTWANGAHLLDKKKDGRTHRAIEFFKRIWQCPNVRMMENPLGVISTIIPHTQIVSPDMFGSEKKKRTCLWLRGLPLLLPTTCKVGKSFIQSLPGSSFKRSILDPYFAQAMVTQWKEYI